MYRILLLVTFFCVCRGEDVQFEVLKSLSDLDQKWMQVHSMPEMAMVLQSPPFSYHTKDLLNKLNLDGIVSKINESRTAKASETGVRSCSDDLVQVLFSIESEWALKMLDSDGKPSSGILRGGTIWPGHFEECNSVYAPKDSSGHGGFSGQYCSTSWSLDLGGKFPKLPLTVGLCVPDSCSEAELMVAGKNLLERIPELTKNNSIITLKDVTCKLKEKNLDIASIVYLVFVSCFVLLVISGSTVSFLNSRRRHASSVAETTDPNAAETCVLNPDSPSVNYGTNEANAAKSSFNIPPHIGLETAACSEKASLTNSVELGVPTIERMPKKIADSLLKRMLLCFSVFENGEKILNTDVTEGQLLSVHGIRFLSLTWVILGHTYIMSVNIIGNKLDVLKEMDNFAFQALLQSPFSVDSFFLLSGFLLAYLFLKEAAKKNGKINWIYFYVHRFWRLTPAYMVVVFFCMYVYKFMSAGPFWEDDHCEANRSTWWMYLLYLSNFIPIHQMCVGWSWYLANDMQFYMISPLFLYPLYRWPKFGFGILASILIATWTTTGVLSYKYNLIPMFVGVTQAEDFDAYATKMWDSFDLIYDKPYCRIAPYIIGVILGFTLFKLNQRKNFLNWWQQVLGWTIAASCSLSVVYGLFHVEMSRTTSLFYNSLCRSAFSIGLAWVIFACETGHGGFITKLLSWKFFIPLSRLTYCAYLTHPILIHSYYQAYQTALYFTELVTVTNFMGFMTMAYGIAFIFSLTFESPLMNLEKLVLKSRSK